MLQSPNRLWRPLDRTQIWEPFLHHFLHFFCAILHLLGGIDFAALLRRNDLRSGIAPSSVTQHYHFYSYSSSPPHHPSSTILAAPTCRAKAKRRRELREGGSQVKAGTIHIIANPPPEYATRCRHPISHYAAFPDSYEIPFAPCAGYGQLDVSPHHSARRHEWERQGVWRHHAARRRWAAGHNGGGLAQGARGPKRGWGYDFRPRRRPSLGRADGLYAGGFGHVRGEALHDRGFREGKTRAERRGAAGGVEANSTWPLANGRAGPTRHELAVSIAVRQWPTRHPGSHAECGRVIAHGRRAVQRPAVPVQVSRRRHQACLERTRRRGNRRVRKVDRHPAIHPRREYGKQRRDPVGEQHSAYARGRGALLHRECSRRHRRAGRMAAGPADRLGDSDVRGRGESER